MSLQSRIQAFMGKDPKPETKVELGATGTSVFAGLLYEEEYNADLRGEKAIKTYDKMRRSDGQVKAGLLASKLPLMVARWDITPASEDQADVNIASAVRDDLFDNMSITWDDFLRHALIMLDFGYMVFEKVWELRDGRYTWDKLAPRLPKSITEWHIKDNGDLDYIIQQAQFKDGFRQVPLPASKLLVFTHEREGSNFTGISLLRAAYKHWWYKNNLYAIDGIASERHGVGLADFTYPDQATQAQKDAVKAIGERLHAHERAYTAHPESVKFDLKGVAGQLHDIMKSVDHHDLQIVRSILAQFMNLGTKQGSYALSQDQSQFFLMALQSVGRNICNTINRHCIREMVDLNWYVKRYPKLTISGLDSPDVLAYAGAIGALMTSGAITPDIDTENELRRMVKLPHKKVAAVPKPEQPVAMRATDFWREPTSVEQSVAFADIKGALDTFEEQFIKAVQPIQRKQTAAMVSKVADYIAKGNIDKLAEIDVPLKDKVADAIEVLLSGLVDYGAEQVKAEAKRQGATMKAVDVEPPDPASFTRVRALSIANILANRMRSAMSWEALRQTRAGALDTGQLTASVDELSDSELLKVSKESAGEAVNMGRQEQAKTMGIKRITSSALLDDNTCDYCREMDGKSWAPGGQPTGVHEPPYRDCEGRDHCRCIWVYTFSQEV